MMRNRNKSKINQGRDRECHPLCKIRPITLANRKAASGLPPQHLHRYHKSLSSIFISVRLLLFIYIYISVTPPLCLKLPEFNFPREIIQGERSLYDIVGRSGVKYCFFLLFFFSGPRIERTIGVKTDDFGLTVEWVKEEKRSPSSATV